MLEIRPPNVTSSITLQKNESVYNVELDLMEENFGENSCSGCPRQEMKLLSTL